MRCVASRCGAASGVNEPFDLTVDKLGQDIRSQKSDYAITTELSCRQWTE